MVRNIQFQTEMASRLSSKRNAMLCTSRLEIDFPPLRPTDCQFLKLTEIESHLFSKEEDSCSSGQYELLEEAVSQCQILGHPVIFVPDWIREMFEEYHDEQSNNSSTESTHQSLNVLESKQRSHSLKSRRIFKSSFVGISKSGYDIITVLNMFKSILIPHWISIPYKDLVTVPRFSDLMLYLCKILGRGPDKYILKFRDTCHNLPFIPVRFPGVDYENGDIPLKSPFQCCDPILDHYRVGSLSQPGSEFRAPDVLRVLRMWDLKQSLSWVEMVQESVTQMCTIGGCHAQRSTMESYLNQ